MTKTTTLFYTHEELNEFGITDEQMRNCGYYKKSFDTIGKVYAKVEYIKLKEQTNGRDSKVDNTNHNL